MRPSTQALSLVVPAVSQVVGNIAFADINIAPCRTRDCWRVRPDKMTILYSLNVRLSSFQPRAL